jgi:hypothetical protein
VDEWADYIGAETLSTDLVPGPVPAGIDRQESFTVAGKPVTLGVKRIRAS